MSSKGNIRTLPFKIWNASRMSKVTHLSFLLQMFAKYINFKESRKKNAKETGKKN